MSHDGQAKRVRLRIGGEKRDFLLTRATPRSRGALDELNHARRTAQAEADRAYRRWSEKPTHETYAAYRAAQDRADAAQDQLAAWVRRCAA